MEGLQRLGDRVNHVDRSLRVPETGSSPVPLDRTLERLVDSVEETAPEVAVTLDVPDENWRVDCDGVTTAIEEAVGHALEHNDDEDDQDRLWVTDRENSRVQIFDTEGEFLGEWTDLIRPTDVAIDGDTVYVSELCKRLSVFTLDGDLLARWGNEGDPVDDPLFVAPHAIAVDSNGDLYVGEVSYTYNGVDRGARTVQKFARSE